MLPFIGNVLNRQIHRDINVTSDRLWLVGGGGGGLERWCWKQGEDTGTDSQGAVSVGRDDKILSIYYVNGCTTLSILKNI